VSAVDCWLNFVVFVDAAVGFSTRKKKLATNWVKSYFVLKHVLGFIPFCNTFISTPSFHFTPKYTPTLIFVSVFPRSDITYILIIHMSQSNILALNTAVHFVWSSTSSLFLSFFAFFFLYLPFEFPEVRVGFTLFTGYENSRGVALPCFRPRH
jgi:hypothetical protein